MAFSLLALYTGEVRRRPPLAKSPAGPAGAFGALLVAAAEQPDAAGGLALAYASLPVAQRSELIPAVIADAHAEGVCPTLLLASLLGAEEDAEVAQQIADAIADVESSELRPASPTRALMAGDAQRGAALLVRPLHGRFVETLALAWDDERGVTQASAESLVAEQDVGRRARELPNADALEPTPVAFAIDTLTSALWSHRRQHGGLPEEIAQFADLFGPPT